MSLDESHGARVDEALARQVEYYRRRASEYDETSVEDVAEATHHFGALLDELAPAGDVLELACGTGLWTQHLVDRATELTALDSSPEMIEVAKARIGDRQATFLVADLFTWQPPRRWDCVFFGFWLSHVPPQRFADFWDLLRQCVARRGRVLFVDEGAPRAAAEPDAASSPVVKRRLLDGSVHELVKVFHHPEDLRLELDELSWSADIELTSTGFLVGTARARSVEAAG